MYQVHIYIEINLSLTLTNGLCVVSFLQDWCGCLHFKDTTHALVCISIFTVIQASFEVYHFNPAKSLQPFLGSLVSTENLFQHIPTNRATDYVRLLGMRECHWHWWLRWGYGGSLPPPFSKMGEVMFSSVFVCLFVCLSVCLWTDVRKSTELICMKFG